MIVRFLFWLEGGGKKVTKYAFKQIVSMKCECYLGWEERSVAEICWNGTTLEKHSTKNIISADVISCHWSC